jgi:Glycosyl transferase family 2
MKDVTVAAVITAYRRVRFLDEALQSVGNQYDKPDEVVVVKSFPDREMDTLGYWRARGVRFVTLGECTIGETIQTGIDATDSEVIALLDDDDLWLPGKLRAVRRAFADEDVNLYRHRYRTQGNYGEHWDATHAQPGTFKLYPLFPGERLAARWICKTAAYAGDSTLAFRRKTLEGRRELIRQVSGSLDFILSVAAMLSGGAHQFDENVHSIRRLHAENVSVGFSGTHKNPVLDPKEVARIVPSVQRLEDWLKRQDTRGPLPLLLTGMVLRYDRALLAGRAPLEPARTLTEVVRTAGDAVARGQPFVLREVAAGTLRNLTKMVRQ